MQHCNHPTVNKKPCRNLATHLWAKPGVFGELKALKRAGIVQEVCKTHQIILKRQWLNELKERD